MPGPPARGFAGRDGRDAEGHQGGRVRGEGVGRAVRTAPEDRGRAGGNGRHLRVLGAAELATRLLGPDQDKGKEPGRGVRLETTLDGAGILAGDLAPGCAAVAGAVLGSLSQPAGKDDTRSHGERMHDALEEAMRRLLAARLLPQRAGAPVTASTSPSSTS